MGHPLNSFVNKIVFLLLISVFLSACSKRAPEQKPEQNVQAAVTPAVPIPQFEGKSAFEYLSKQVEFGPRAPNTDAHQQCLSYLQQVLKSYADSVELQTFTVPGYNGVLLRLTNVVAHFNLKSSTRVLLSAHWDSSPRADQEPGGAIDKPIPGADDGASGVAVLLEIARGLRQSPPPVGVDIILWDGEDYGKEGDMDYYCLGSKYWAATKPFSYQPIFAVNLDMIGQKDLAIPREGYSVQYAGDVVDLFWNTAAEMGVDAFVDRTIDPIYDDHLQLDNVGMKAIDLIDFNYKYWHTLQDTPDKCSPESLSAVGRVLLRVIYRKIPVQPQ